MIINRIKELSFSEIRAMNRKANENTINLGIGRPFCETPSSIKEAGIKAIKNNKTYYSNNMGIKKLREVISNRYNLGSFENSLVTVGAAEGIYTAMVSILTNEDEVLIPNPGYLAYEPIGKMIGCIVKDYPLKSNHQLNIDEIEKKINEKTKMIIINNPGNPTGVMFNESDLKELIKIAKKRNLVILSDESYQGLVYNNGKCKSLADFDLSKNIIVLSSVSKEFSMTGWRVGWIYTHKDNIDEMVKPHLYINSCASTISQYAAYEAIKGNTREVVNKLKENKIIMKNYLDKMENINYIESDSGLYYFIDISFYGDDKEVAIDLLKKENVLTIPGSVFGDNGKGHLRLSFGAKPNDIKEAMNRILRYFN